VHLIEELGLADLAAGTPFRITLLGEDVAGDVWFRSDNQLGITVDAWDDGLLIVSSADPTASKPQEWAMAILSTYELDDARLAALDTRWRQWWTERFPVDR
jgi:hypothetical protein